ncbi:MAG: hypothetical protein Q9163_001017 [Psora crenata]
MEITKYIVSQREKALLLGDYGTYRRQLTRRLPVVRKKLYPTTSKGRTYTARQQVTAEDIGSNHEFVHLLLLTSERAWAHAMYMRSMQPADTGAKGIMGSTRRHIMSRLQKARVGARHLVELLDDKEASKASLEAILEAQAYYVSLCGAITFEKQQWTDCIRHYSEARLIYTTLFPSRSVVIGDDLLRDRLTSNVDSSIRYAAYKLKIPRTTSVESLVSQYLPKDTNAYIEEILERNPEALDNQAAGNRKSFSSDDTDIPKTVQWRSRTVKLEDGATAQALAAVSSAEKRLSSFLLRSPNGPPRAKAAAYDEVLIPSQDAVDATRTAIEELTADGVPQGDLRMQSLQLTRTAVNYALIGWRTGRNRILCGEQDGADLEPLKPKRLRTVRQNRKHHEPHSAPVESKGHQLKRLKERVVLYDATLQSLESVLLLPGVAADQPFVHEIEAKRSYFAALRCLAIARSYRLLGNLKEAVALLVRALEQCSVASKSTTLSKELRTHKPPDLTVSVTQVTELQVLLQSLLTQHRALFVLYGLLGSDSKSDVKAEPPLIERLEEYPQSPVDLTALVTYPPKLEPIPVKPLFLDVAYNYIEYPWRMNEPEKRSTTVNGAVQTMEKKEVKKGWFSFGR